MFLYNLVSSFLSSESWRLISLFLLMSPQPELSFFQGSDIPPPGMQTRSLPWGWSHHRITECFGVERDVKTTQFHPAAMRKDTLHQVAQLHIIYSLAQSRISHRKKTLYSAKQLMASDSAGSPQRESGVF